MYSFRAAIIYEMFCNSDPKLRQTVAVLNAIKYIFWINEWTT